MSTDEVYHDVETDGKASFVSDVRAMEGRTDLVIADRNGDVSFKSDEFG